MIVYPNAKLNLGLQITGRRADGYHLLDSLFLPIPLRDVLEVICAEGASSEADALQVYGDVETGDIANNLVLRAVRKLRAEGYALPPLSLHLYKHIPSGAGMGGGSADASFALRAVRDLLQLPIDNAELERLALSLGADCPFFVENNPRMVSGIGEVLAPAPALPLEGLYLVLTKPMLHISTAEAFAGLGEVGGHRLSVREIIIQPIDVWREHLVNDFERSLFPKYPQLERLKRWHYEQGALYASMTGSGSTIYALYSQALDKATLGTHANCFCWQCRL